MKYRLTINIDEDTLLMTIAKAQDMAFLLWDLDQELRSKVKYNDNDFEANVYEKMREEFHQMLRDRGIDLDDLVR